MQKVKILFLVILTSCHTKNRDCTVTANEILRQNPNKVYVLNRKNGMIKAISDSGLHNIVRGIYYFSDEGKLESYKYFEDTLAYSYNEEYDEKGELVKHEGEALVSRVIWGINHDSAVIKALFFSLHKTFPKLKVSINDSIKLELPLIDDRVFSNIKTARFEFSTHNLSKIQILYSIRYSNDCTGKDTTLIDTTNLVKDTQLRLVDE